MSWVVVIPSAKSSNLIRSVRSIFSTHPHLDPKRIVVVDDGAKTQAEPELPSGITWIKGVAPFIYARNVNLGVGTSSSHDTVILGDDAEVVTLGAFDRLSDYVAQHSGTGILSAGIRGFVGNENQKEGTGGFRGESNFLAFICVMVPRRIWEKVGLLDEQFAGYGCDDLDFSWRVRNAGYSLGTLPDCVVRHGELPSTFRERPDFSKLFLENKERFRAKWQYPLP